MTAFEDVPAAHSMDTTWFAVDADGCVGVFDSSEDGAVPNHAATGGYSDAPSFDVFFLNAALVARLYRAEPGRFDPLPGVAPPQPRADRVVVMLKEAPYRDAGRKPVEEELPDAQFRPIGKHALVSREHLSVDEQTRLREHPNVAALIAEGSFGRYDLFLDNPGIYRYAHDFGDSYEPGRYKRSNEASEALKLAEVPEPARAEIGKLRLPVRFREAERIHLADHLSDGDCSIWAQTSLRGEPNEEAAPQAAPTTTRRQRTAVLNLVLIVFVLFVILIAVLRS